jgi:DNA-binding ferritin-like protein (Dps family)
MADLEAQVLTNRASRDAARATFDKHYGAIKADIEERGIAGRVLDETVEQAKDMFDEAVAVAETHPGVIGGTIAALALWFLRNPIIAWIEKALEPVMDKMKETDSD